MRGAASLSDDTASSPWPSPPEEEREAPPRPVTPPVRTSNPPSFQLRRGRIVWTEKARTRFKERIQAITSRSRGVSTYCMLSELRRYVVGWLNYFGYQPGLSRDTGNGQMAAAAGAHVLLETVEARPRTAA